MKSKKLTRTQWDNLVDAYKAGSIVSHLSVEYGVDTQVINRRLKNIGVQRHTKEHTTRIGKGHTLREDAFSCITSDSAYWAGFICGDGNVDKAVISIGLSAIDRGHLEKFKNFLGSSCVIQEIVRATSYGTSKMAKIAIGSKRMTNDLKTLFGIGPNKTFTASVPEHLRMNRDFWRGLVDADGTVSHYRLSGRVMPIIQLVGSLASTEQFAEYMKTVCGTRATPHPHKSIFKVIASCHMAEKVIENLYSNAETYLDRKKEKADAIIAAAKHN